ncbi:unnamed protein product [Agarophyton chilense]
MAGNVPRGDQYPTAVTAAAPLQVAANGKKGDLRQISRVVPIAAPVPTPILAAPNSAAESSISRPDKAPQTLGSALPNVSTTRVSRRQAQAMVGIRRTSLPTPVLAQIRGHHNEEEVRDRSHDVEMAEADLHAELNEQQRRTVTRTLDFKTPTAKLNAHGHSTQLAVPRPSAKMRPSTTSNVHTSDSDSVDMEDHSYAEPSLPSFEDSFNMVSNLIQCAHCNRLGQYQLHEDWSESGVQTARCGHCTSILYGAELDEKIAQLYTGLMPIVDLTAKDAETTTQKTDLKPQTQEEIECTRTEFDDMGANTKSALRTSVATEQTMPSTHKHTTATAPLHKTTTRATFKPEFQNVKHLINCSACSSTNSLVLNGKAPSNRLLHAAKCNQWGKKVTGQKLHQIVHDKLTEITSTATPVHPPTTTLEHTVARHHKEMDQRMDTMETVVKNIHYGLKQVHDKLDCFNKNTASTADKQTVYPRIQENQDEKMDQNKRQMPPLRQDTQGALQTLAQELAMIRVELEALRAENYHLRQQLTKEDDASRQENPRDPTQDIMAPHAQETPAQEQAAAHLRQNAN